MKTIRELFSKPIERTIEEVIKVDQNNEKTVLTELEEYILTDSIRGHFKEVYREIAEGQARPREGIGVWVSGFFGSGKSSFAKILGYTVAKRKVGTHDAAGIFKDNAKDGSVSALLDSIITRIPFHAVIFDVSMERGVRTANERLTEIMYKALLRELDYAEDFDLASLEITLESDHRLDEFTKRFEAIHGKTWKVRRKLGLAINEASAVLHDLDPKTYSTPDSYATTLAQGRADITPNTLADRAFDLAARRMPGKALIFIIDEVGQYVSRSVDKMLDLQAIIQAFGVEGKNLVEKKQAVSPFWIIVTSQEKLNEVVHALDSKKIELARLQDRFRIAVDLKQSDIMEVTSKRVLDKNNAAKQFLAKLYEENEGRIKACCTLERTSRDTSIDRSSFVNLYPYFPYQVDLCIDVVAGLRLKRGAHRHVGGSNRTIIKQAQEMMINPRTNLAAAKPGALVTLDKVYELLYLGNLLPSETTREIDDLIKNVPANVVPHKVAKAIALLESVKDLPRTVHNLAVVLHPSVEADSLKNEVQDAIAILEKAQIIRESDEGYKLLTVQEKSWETTRNAKEPREADRNRIKDEAIKEVFADPKVRGYRYKELRSFKPSLAVEYRAIDSAGEFQLNIFIADDVQSRQERFNEARDESNARRNELFWVVTLGNGIYDLITELYRSREMVNEHERIASQGHLTPEEASCLSDEKVRRDRFQRNLRTKFQEVIQAGSGFFQGVQKDASGLGKNLTEVFHTFFDQAVPVLYPKLEIGVLPVKGNEPEKFLSSTNLQGLPELFRDPDPSRALVVQQSGKWVPNLGAEICREIFGFLKKEHSYGSKVTGKSLEHHFGGIGYAWNLEPFLTDLPFQETDQMFRDFSHLHAAHISTRPESMIFRSRVRTGSP